MRTLPNSFYVDAMGVNVLSAVNSRLISEQRHLTRRMQRREPLQRLLLRLAQVQPTCATVRFVFVEYQTRQKLLNNAFCPGQPNWGDMDH